MDSSDGILRSLWNHKTYVLVPFFVACSWWAAITLLQHRNYARHLEEQSTVVDSLIGEDEDGIGE